MYSHAKLMIGASLLTIMSFDTVADSLIPSSICLQSTSSIAPDLFKSTWYLHFSPVENDKNLYEVNGFELGEKDSPAESYVDGMDGTVVVASESNMLNEKETLHISLQGSGSDLKKDIHDMWHTDAIFDLNPATFGGNLMSTTTDSIIPSGIQSHEPVKSSITRNIVVKKVTCPASVTDIVSNSVKKDITAAIRSMSEEWSNAMLQKDTSIFDRIWASDFIYVEPSGRRFNKAEGIADLKNSTDTITSSVVSSVDVRVYGGGTVAVDIGDYKEIGKDKDGKSFEKSSLFTNVWVLKEGKWQCVSGHSSNLPITP